MQQQSFYYYFIIISIIYKIIVTSLFNNLIILIEPGLIWAVRKYFCSLSFSSLPVFTTLFLEAFFTDVVYSFDYITALSYHTF